MNTWTSGGHFPQVNPHHHGPLPLLISPFVRFWCQPKHRTLSLRLRRSHKPPSLRFGRHLFKRAAPAASSSSTSLRIGGPSAAASSRRPPTLRSGRFPSLESSFRVIALDRHPHCNPALLKKISCSSSSFPCFVSRFLLRFCLVLRRSLSSSSSQLNNTRSHSSAQTRPS